MSTLPWASHVTASTLPPPWATEAVDRLICALDAQDLSTPMIIARVKRAFPSLRVSVITADIIERRLRVLDQWIDVDYFKGGLGGSLSGVPFENGLQGSIGVRHGKSIHHGYGEAWEVDDNSRGENTGVFLRARGDGNENINAKTVLNLPPNGLPAELPTITLNGAVTAGEPDISTVTKKFTRTPSATQRNSAIAVAKAKAIVKDLTKSKHIDNGEGIARREAHVRRRRVGGMAPPAALLAKR